MAALKYSPLLMGVRARIASAGLAALAGLVAVGVPSHAGAADRHERIAGGSVVGSDGWPWAVFMVDGVENFTCSGVLISPRVVATAAHCVEPSSQLFVTAEQTATDNVDDYVEVVGTAVIPSYDENDFESPDVGRVVLEEPLPDTESIELLDPTLTAEVVGSGAVALSAGYGRTSGSATDSGVLREGAFGGLDPCFSGNKVCTTSGPPHGCSGDSGGPLIVQLGADTVTANPNPTNGEWRLAGITSGGDVDCAFFSAFSSLTDSEQHNFMAPPETQITKGPKRRTEKRKAAFEFVAVGGTGGSERFRCALDEGKFENCDSPYKTPRLKKGKHTLEVRASVDFIEDFSPAKHSWKVVG